MKREWLLSPSLLVGNFGGALWLCLLGDDNRMNRMAPTNCFYHWLGADAELNSGK